MFFLLKSIGLTNICIYRKQRINKRTKKERETERDKKRKRETHRERESTYLNSFSLANPLRFLIIDNRYKFITNRYS